MDSKEYEPKERERRKIMWSTHFEILPDNDSDRIAMVFPCEEGSGWWWVVFNEDQSRLLGSGSDDELDYAIENAKDVLNRQHEKPPKIFASYCPFCGKPITSREAR